jgi:hypothetical protein
MRNWSLVFDLMIIAKTLAVVWRDLTPVLRMTPVLPVLRPRPQSICWQKGRQSSRFVDRPINGLRSKIETSAPVGAGLPATPPWENRTPSWRSAPA